MLQAHYLAPLGFSEAYSPVWDSSGYKITLRRVRPRDSAAGQGKHAVGLLALNDYGLNYPKGRSRHTHSYLIEEAALRDSLKGDFADFGGEVQPVAVHLHGHSLTKRIWIDHLRGGLVGSLQDSVLRRAQRGPELLPAATGCLEAAAVWRLVRVNCEVTHPPPAGTSLRRVPLHGDGLCRGRVQEPQPRQPEQLREDGKHPVDMHGHQPVLQRGQRERGTRGARGG